MDIIFQKEDKIG